MTAADTSSQSHFTGSIEGRSEIATAASPGGSP
jgi:hypothetical protein